MSDVKTRAEARAAFERLCWRLSGWNVEQRSVDELLAALDVYAGFGPGVESQGAAALVSDGGAGAAELPADTPAGVALVPDVPQPVTGAQTGVQRLEVTGTLTLVCGGGCTPVQPVQKTQPARKRSRYKRVPENKRKKGYDTPDDHNPALPEDYRTCRVCEQRQLITEYVKDVHGRRGRKTICRTCENTRKRDARAARAAQRAAA